MVFEAFLWRWLTMPIDPAYGIPADQMDGLDAVTAGLRGAAGRDALLALIAAVEGEHTPGYLRELHRRKVLRTPLPVLRQSYAGHWLHQERPDDFNVLLMDWLAGVSS
jgi:hypothetical protein